MIASDHLILCVFGHLSIIEHAVCNMVIKKLVVLFIYFFKLQGIRPASTRLRHRRGQKYLEND